MSAGLSRSRFARLVQNHQDHGDVGAVNQGLDPVQCCSEFLADAFSSVCAEGQEILTLVEDASMGWMNDAKVRC